MNSSLNGIFEVKTPYEDDIASEFKCGFEEGMNFGGDNESASQSVITINDLTQIMKEMKEEKGKRISNLFQRDIKFVCLPPDNVIPREFTIAMKKCKDENRKYKDIMISRCFLWSALYLHLVKKESIASSIKDSPHLLTLWKKEASSLSLTLEKYINDTISMKIETKD